ncbi:uncharacterized protein PGTG_16209 [Puccinia graminis f. sp. tritici CRL 75-36-700-3]|uniref:Uncharacterized protein n=1 Tax=Puccinia graminis f. sp. tritici (strain CRL 75-36-700-3 / race SCCL) TaxID=418459 RepID=E3L034_PUCGT|nr:uncharacterized protein PGTG_16209 [Puccinia graminis f. sp. tritici CRL 75-36-700-3]EFP89921.1 hypothetical protein PGTG_16209 [Puccinia graminis f. sp. tritici CRL 75-36-700-3]
MGIQGWWRIEFDQGLKKKLTRNSGWAFWRWHHVLRVDPALKDIQLSLPGKEFHSTIVGVAVGEATFGAAVAGSKADGFGGPLARVGEGRGNRGSVRGHYGWRAPKGRERERGREKRMCWQNGCKQPSLYCRKPFPRGHLTFVEGAKSQLNWQQVIIAFVESIVENRHRKLEGKLVDQKLRATGHGRSGGAVT